MPRISLDQINRRVVGCKKCPELRSYCAEVGRVKRRAFAEWTYWAKPVPGFGDPKAWLWIVGLAPAAHGANRTARVFTGDRSGDFLFAGLHRAGLANQPHSVHKDDGLALRGVYISASVRCAPPANKPTPAQQGNCRPYLWDEWRALKRKRVILALGAIAWENVLALGEEIGEAVLTPRPKFAHGAEASLGPVTLLGCYHVSQQNTFTGKLTAMMFDANLARAQAIARGVDRRMNRSKPGV